MIPASRRIDQNRLERSITPEAPANILRPVAVYNGQNNFSSIFEKGEACHRGHLWLTSTTENSVTNSYVQIYPPIDAISY